MLQGIFSILDQVLLADPAATGIVSGTGTRHRNGPRHFDAAWLLQRLNSLAAATAQQQKNLQLSYDMALDFNQTGQGSVQPYTILPMRPMPMRPCRQAPAAAPSSIYRLCAT